MTSLLEYLRRGFDNLESITKDEFDELFERIRIYRTNPNPDELQQLVGLTSHFYNLSGTKLAQIYVTKAALERQLERRKIDLARCGGVALSKKSEIERLASLDENCQTLDRQIDETKGIEIYFTHTRESLFMVHYALRKDTDVVAPQRGRVHHGG